MYYQDSPGSGGGACSVLIDSILQARTSSAVAGNAQAPQSVTLKLKIEDGTTGGRYIEAPVQLTSVSMQCAQGEVFSAACTFEVNGAPTEVVL